MKRTVEFHDGFRNGSFGERQIAYPPGIGVCDVVADLRQSPASLGIVLINDLHLSRARSWPTAT